MAEKVTVMVLKVDLQCATCYKKMKKLLCRTPQVRDQIFDEKQNLVTISVVTCCPDKIRDKLRSKGGKVIKGIDIKEAPKPKPKEPEKPKSDDKPKEAAKPKSDDKPKADMPKVAEKLKPGKPKEAEKSKVGEPKEAAEKPKEPEKPKADKPKDAEKPKAAKAEDKPAAKEVQAYMYGPPVYSVPGIVGPDPFVQYGYPVANPGWGYGEPSYEGYVAAPVPYYNNGFGRPVPPEPCYNGYNYGHGYNEESPPMCTIV